MTLQVTAPILEKLSKDYYTDYFLLKTCSRNVKGSRFQRVGLSRVNSGKEG